MAFFSTVARHFRVFGVTRSIHHTRLSSDADFTVIEDTPQCEDIHYHQPSHTIFAAGEANNLSRFSWWPILSNYDAIKSPQRRGKLIVINPDTLKARALHLEDFDKPFLTHGIDVVDDSAVPRGVAVYIFAINHEPNPLRRQQADGKRPKSHSVVEVFRHRIGSDVATHVRSVWHPLITTPNDVVALSETSFLVTNDHYLRESPLKFLEDMNWLWRRSNVAHIRFGMPTEGGARMSEDEGVQGSIALRDIHNANGIGHGKSRDEVIVISGTSGTAHVGTVVEDEIGQASIQVTSSVKLDSCLDNPSYFNDPFATADYDASTFLLTGLARAAKIFFTMRNPRGKDPGIVWRLTRMGGGGTRAKERQKWRVGRAFEDDGSRIRSSSTSLLVAIDPDKEGGRRRAWMFVTGFYARNMIAFKVDI